MALKPHNERQETERGSNAWGGSCLHQQFWDDRNDNKTAGAWVGLEALEPTNARAKGKRLGRPSKGIDAAAIAELSSQGASWRAIAEKLGVSVGTPYRVAQGCSKTQEQDFRTH